jgi:hypothetical protein
MPIDMLERADPHASYRLRGGGEPPALSSTPPIVAAIREHLFSPSEITLT